jgi:hypothetical protein
MSVSETLLSIVAFRLAVVVLFVASAQMLPVRSHHDDPIPLTSGAVIQAAACVPATDSGRDLVLIDEMLKHD